MKLMKLLVLWPVLCLVAYAYSTQDRAADILAEAKRAAGGSALDSLVSLYTRAKVSMGGLTGTSESWDDVLTGRSLTRFEIGPLSGAQGFDGQTVWSQDSSKQSHAEEGGDARAGAMDEAYRRTMAFWYPERWPARIEFAGEQAEGDRRFLVVRITPRGGRAFDIWVDAATRLFDRTIEKTALETRTTFFSDYRDVSGIKLPFATRSTNGEERYDQVTAVERVEVNAPLQEGMFRMPPPPAPDYTLAEGRTSTSVPFELLNNHIYLEARLNGRGPFPLLCDTGGANIVTPELAAELGLTSEGALQGRGVGEKSEDIGITKVQTLEVGGVTLHDQVFAVYPLADLGRVEGVPIRGLIGYEVFKRFVVEVDYERLRLVLTLPSAFAYSGHGVVVPFRFNGQIPQVEGEVDGLPGRFDIDTGSRSSLTILGPFAEKHNLAARYPRKVEAVTGWGVGGPARGLVTRAGVLKLGGVEVHGPVLDISLQAKGAFTDPYVAGNVGAGVLKRFNIIFDYGNQKLIFEPNRNFSAPDDYDRAGLWLNLSGDTFEVMDVTAGGPAAEVAIKPGERILEIDGRAASELSLPGLRSMFRSSPAGTRFRLSVQSGEAKREVVLTLRDLIEPDPRSE
jgi:hypothetical protein